jgi:two-component system CheB/CheR fusion protein
VTGPRPLRVLVVDANHDAADSLCLLLRLWGHNAAAAYDAPTVLTMAGAGPPDVVLLEPVLPGVGGWELARRLRDDPALAGVLLIAVTALGTAADRLRSGAAGIRCHLTKPADPELLRWLLAAYAGRR